MAERGDDLQERVSAGLTPRLLRFSLSITWYLLQCPSDMEHYPTRLLYRLGLDLRPVVYVGSVCERDDDEAHISVFSVCCMFHWGAGETSHGPCMA